MSTGIEPSKTECPMCGNVWQEYTLNQLDGCMAIMHLEFTAALGGGNTIARTTTDEPCPVCHKLPYEHSNDDIRSCLGKWRKRERGATGLELRAEFLERHFENEEPDPVKRAQLRAQARQRLCSGRSSFGEQQAGFDVLEQPLEVKRRIGYLPEAPLLYPEMETAAYLKFVGKLKGLSGAHLGKQVDYFVIKHEGLLHLLSITTPRLFHSASNPAARQYW